ncbi:MAG TPA: glycosyltransferase, partial [Bacteroidales bacterium]|nr:glycosyltransferase [Bacteroidales bacterium]
MKVLMVTTSYPDYEGSNRGIFIRRLCRELVNQGVEVVVLTPRIFSQSPLFEEEQGIRVYRFRFPSRNKPLNQIESVPVFAMFIYMLSGLFTALRLVMKEKPDVIHGNWIVPTGLIASLAGFLARTPVVNTARGMDVRVSEKGVLRFLFYVAVKLSDCVTVVSEAMRNRPCLSSAEVITSGVNEAFFRIAPDRCSLTILHTRSLEKIYDVETLIRAVPLVLEQLPEARFVIAGT